jgi:hypothetical protein
MRLAGVPADNQASPSVKGHRQRREDEMIKQLTALRGELLCDHQVCRLTTKLPRQPKGSDRAKAHNAWVAGAAAV